MNRDPILHIGFHKTGTTFLQNHFFYRKDQGFVCPWTVYTGEAIKHFVLEHPKRFDPYQVRKSFDAATKKISNAELVPIISHEDLCGYPVYSRYYGYETASRLKKTFPNSRVIIGIREQNSMIKSLYGQYVRQDGEWGIDQFLGTGSEQPGFSPICRLDHLEYNLLVEYYIDLFGKESVLAIPYELLKKDQHLFLDTIMQFSGVTNKFRKVYDPLNIGRGSGTLEINRILNRYIKRQPLWNGNYKLTPFSWKLKHKICDLIDKITPNKLQDKHEKYLKNFIQHRVVNYYTDANRKLQTYTPFDLNSFGYKI